jgi:hypothetical protein
MLNSVITRIQINDNGRLISVIDGALQIFNLTSSANDQVNVDTQGIYMSDAEVTISASAFSGQVAKSKFTTIY